MYYQDGLYLNFDKFWHNTMFIVTILSIGKTLNDDNLLFI